MPNPILSPTFNPNNPPPINPMLVGDQYIPMAVKPDLNMADIPALPEEALGVTNEMLVPQEPVQQTILPVPQALPAQAAQPQGISGFIDNYVAQQGGPMALIQKGLSGLEEQYIQSQLTPDQFLTRQNQLADQALKQRQQYLDTLAMEYDNQYKQQDLILRQEDLRQRRELLGMQLTGQNISNMVAMRDLGYRPSPDGGMVYAPKPMGGDVFEGEVAKASAAKAADILSSAPDFAAFEDSIKSAKEAIKNVEGYKTLPIIKGAMTASGDASLNNLNSTLSDLAVRMRTIVKMPASGFSDADAARLDRIVGGQESANKEVIQGIIERLEKQSEVTKQSQANLVRGLGQRYGTDVNVSGSIAGTQGQRAGAPTQDDDPLGLYK